ncbi:MAG TPA: CNP1-like family protein, partial [Burkholderiales bacterium]|nr:CNP1-like family protein [Burkholderiales bacterium]
PLKAIAPGFVLVLAACGASGPRSDWERANEEKLPAAEQQREALPTPPAKRGELLEFFVAATSEFRFFVDAASLSVGSDGIVRYVLVARSSTGTENVSFEGMRCATREVRIYALGRDGAWVGRETDWRAIQPRSVQRWHNALYREYFCPQAEPIRSAGEGADALRRGGHPMQDLSGDIRRGR